MDYVPPSLCLGRGGVPIFPQYLPGQQTGGCTNLRVNWLERAHRFSRHVGAYGRNEELPSFFSSSLPGRIEDMLCICRTIFRMVPERQRGEISKIRDDIPIVLCTGCSKRISDERIAEYGVKALISKPISRKDMAKAVRKVLDE